MKGRWRKENHKNGKEIRHSVSFFYDKELTIREFISVKLR
jgi:hypothetical protein